MRENLQERHTTATNAHQPDPAHPHKQPHPPSAHHRINTQTRTTTHQRNNASTQTHRHLYHHSPQNTNPIKRNKHSKIHLQTTLKTTNNETVAVKAKNPGGKLKDFKDTLDKSPPAELAALKAEVEAFAKAFPTIGFEKGAMRYSE